MKNPKHPITTDLVVVNQGVNVDIESIAPVRQFNQSAYDVANSTITATVQAPEEKVYRLVLAADVEAGTAAFVRVVSATEQAFDVTSKFQRIAKRNAELLKPVLAKAGIALDPNQSERKQLESLVRHYKVADIKIPAGQQVLRIHASQKLHPVDGNPRRYSVTIYAPQLSFAPTGSVRLGATVVFPLDLTTRATVDQPVIEPLPGQPAANQTGGGPVDLGGHAAYGWTFQADPKITIAYTYQ